MNDLLEKAAWVVVLTAVSAAAIAGEGGARIAQITLEIVTAGITP